MKVSDKTFSKVSQKCLTQKGLLSLVLNLKLEQNNPVGRGLLLLTLVLINGYSISRAAGAMYQSARGNAIVKVSDMKLFNKNKNIFQGPCLRYDPVNQILVATPFKGGVDCWNSGDWLVILCPIGLLVSLFPALIWICC